MDWYKTSMEHQKLYIRLRHINELHMLYSRTPESIQEETIRAQDKEATHVHKDSLHADMLFV
jgi:hypothetical protein